jgi:hypothetical protein
MWPQRESLEADLFLRDPYVLISTQNSEDALVKYEGATLGRAKGPHATRKLIWSNARPDAD